MNKGMKPLFILFFVPFFFACQSKTDLLSLKFDQDVSKLIKEDKQLKTGRDVIFGLRGYVDDAPDGYAIGGTKLSSYHYPDSDPAHHNKLLIYINGEVNYLGFLYTSVNQEESAKIIADLQRKYPKFKKVAARGYGDSFLWDVPEIHAWMIVYHRKRLDKDGKEFMDANFVVVKEGTHMGNRSDNINIYDYYTGMMDEGVLQQIVSP